MRHFRKTFSVVHIGIVLFLLHLFLLVTLGGPQGKGPDDKIAPGLARVLAYYEATHKYDAEIPVIVQVAPDSFHPHGAPPGLLKSKALGLVKGFAGKMSIRGIHGLVRSPWIEYVTLDAAVSATSNPLTSSIGVEQTLGSGGAVDNLLGHDGEGVVVAVFDSGIAEHSDLTRTSTVRDEFSAISYSNNDGPHAWATDWIEFDDNNSPSTGTVRIEDNRLRIDNADSGALPSAVRSAYFSGIKSAVLTFDFNYFAEGGLDIVAVEVSTDGGGSYTLLENLELVGTITDSRSYNLGDYINLGADLTVRFRVVQGLFGPGQYVAFDNVEIRASAGAEHTAQAGPSGSYQDQFSTVSYNNDDGSLSWSNPWAESNDDSSPSAGTVRIEQLQLRMDNSSGSHPSVNRSADLSETSSATLSFDFNGYARGKSSAVAVEVSDNGGSTYSLLENLQVSGSVSGSRTYVLEDVISLTPNAVVHFRIVEGFKKTNQYIAFDNVQITASPSSTTFVSVDFTSGVPEFSTAYNDGYGHGTHVSGIIGGSGYASAGQYSGVAPDADFLHLKVLGDYGIGATSNLILAIDWLIQNQDAYNVRVANLSLGHPAFESYTTDPLCQAVRAMVDAGIVTVVSAGNLGKTLIHPELWGGITSPGTEPSAITVGAVNTKGTATHTDDVTTSYSSRGYTLPDQLLKPDLVAPGNRIPGPAVAGSFIEQYYPHLKLGDDHLSLSGSSMATAFVSGAAALILDANPDLSPTQVKTLLLLSAVKMTEPHMFEQGNGLLNAYTAVKLAEQMDMTNQSLSGNVSPLWILNGEYGPEEVVAGGAFVWDDRVFYSDLVAPSSGFWGEGVIWSDNLFDPGSVIWTDNFFDPGSVIWSDFFDSMIWADFFDSVIWADFFDSVIWADFFDSVIWADFFDPGSVIWADTVIWTEDPANSTEGD